MGLFLSFIIDLTVFLIIYDPGVFSVFLVQLEGFSVSFVLFRMEVVLVGCKDFLGGSLEAREVLILTMLLPFHDLICNIRAPISPPAARQFPLLRGKLGAFGPIYLIRVKGSEITFFIALIVLLLPLTSSDPNLEILATNTTIKLIINLLCV